MSLLSIVLTVVFTFIALLIISAVMRRKAKKVKEIGEEPVIIGDAASLCKGRAGMYGGYLFLTNNRLVFKPSRFSGFGKRAEIPLDSITKVSSERNLIGEENILKVSSPDAEYGFMVNDLQTWISKINELRKENADTRYCMYCGSTISVTANFCSRCGRKKIKGHSKRAPKAEEFRFM